MSEIALKEASPTIDRPRMDADIVCVGLGPAFGLMLQIVTSNRQLPFHQSFVFPIPVATT
jgi:hypothetical protein